MKQIVIRDKNNKIKEVFNKWSELPPKDGLYKDCTIVIVEKREVTNYRSK